MAIIDIDNLPKEHLEALYIGLIESLKPEVSEEFLGAYIENLEEYREEMGGPEYTLQDAIDNMADNVHDMNDRDVLDLLDQAFGSLIERASHT
jgi:hypothetical protein